MQLTREAFEALLAAAPDPASRLRVAAGMAGAGLAGEAAAVAAAALADAPSDPEVWTLAHEVLSAGVPQWHFSLMRDGARNEAFDRALRRAVRPGMRVLEIGTGSGLLAMMAARAGAAEVVTCEANPQIAEAARQIVALNGYADQIRVIAKHSGDLRVGVDLAGPADLLVSEILGADLFSEHALLSIEAAARHLLTSEAAIVPAAVSVQVALAETPAPAPRRMGVVSGFDLTPFNRLQRPYEMRPARARVALRSEALALFRIDFQSRSFAFSERATAPAVSTGGRVNAVVQWLRLEMDGHGAALANPPGVHARSAWGAMTHYLPAAIETAPGQPLHITGVHDAETLHLWAEPA
jgi:type II protein arginine methyltransferase